MHLTVRTEILKTLLNATRAIDDERRRIEGHFAMGTTWDADQKADLAALDKAWLLVTQAFDAIGLG